MIGLDPSEYGHTHSVEPKQPQILQPNEKSSDAVQLLLGHTKLENTVRYLGIGVDDALEMAEQTEV